MASTSLTRTHGSATTGNIYTWSGWVKRGIVNVQETLANTRTDDNNYSRIRFDSNNTLMFEAKLRSSTVTNWTSTALFLDLSAWYHVVVRVDYTQATAGDRARIYVNGTEVSYSTTTRQSQNGSSYFNSANSHFIGTYNSNNYFTGSMAHVHFCDGQSYAPTVFGETDSTTGIWKPITSPSVTYGNNGYFLKFQDSSNFGDDSSGNTNDFTLSGTMTQNVDTPSNNFATLNPLYTIEYNSALSMSSCNTTADLNNATWNTIPCTMAVSNGKWYFEGYGHDNSNNYLHYGITSQAKMNANATQAQSEIQANANGYAEGYYGNNGYRYYSTTSASTSAAYGASYTSTDYIGIFMDLDNNKLYFAKNGTLQNSGTGLDINADGKPYLLATAIYDGKTNVNFGNGSFGSTKLTGTTYSDANGYGTFKYSPNQGGAANFDGTAKNFYAMNTKNLKEFGG